VLDYRDDCPNHLSNEISKGIYSVGCLVDLDQDGRDKSRRIEIRVTYLKKKN
jgi:hypothetical protein